MENRNTSRMVGSLADLRISGIITFHSIMLLSLLAHAPLESRATENASGESRKLITFRLKVISPRMERITVLSRRA